MRKYRSKHQVVYATQVRSVHKRHLFCPTYYFISEEGGRFEIDRDIWNTYRPQPGDIYVDTPRQSVLGPTAHFCDKTVFEDRYEKLEEDIDFFHLWKAIHYPGRRGEDKTLRKEFIKSLKKG